MLEAETGKVLWQADEISHEVFAQEFLPAVVPADHEKGQHFFELRPDHFEKQGVDIELVQNDHGLWRADGISVPRTGATCWSYFAGIDREDRHFVLVKFLNCCCGR